MNRFRWCIPLKWEAVHVSVHNPSIRSAASPAGNAQQRRILALGQSHWLPVARFLEVSAGVA